MKKNRGFTLIELLAVIVILAVIALIAVPNVIKILNNARLSSAEDSVYGIVESAESYVASFMLKNKGSLPGKDLEFDCSKTGCVLNTTDLDDYDLTNLNELNFKGVKPEKGTVIIQNNGQTIKATNLVINGFTCNYPNDEGEASCQKGTNSDDNPTYASGDAMELGGYNWHVISDYNGYITLLMDAGQIEDMNHCTNDTDVLTDCGVDSTGSYYVYSWDKSLINSYLKNTLYPELKDKITNEIVPVSVCVDPSRADGNATYGGYLKSEIEKISEASCNSYETDYVRLITNSEYFNLSPYYSETNTRYPNISGITRLSEDSDYANWLYCTSGKCGGTTTPPPGYWWTMASYSRNVNHANSVNHLGNFNASFGKDARGVRPVITIKK